MAVVEAYRAASQKAYAEAQVLKRGLTDMEVLEGMLGEDCCQTPGALLLAQVRGLGWEMHRRAGVWDGGCTVWGCWCVRDGFKRIR